MALLDERRVDEAKAFGYRGGEERPPRGGTTGSGRARWPGSGPEADQDKEDAVKCAELPSISPLPPMSAPP